MKQVSRFLLTSPMLALAMLFLVLPVYGQFSIPCTSSMLTTFTPCMNFITKSSLNGTSPTVECCGAVKSLASNGLDCLCQIAIGSVPFQVPINRALAFSLPRACKTKVPVQCKASPPPAPAPGPDALDQTSVDSPPSTEGSTASTPPPESDTTQALSPSTTASTEVPTSTTSSHPVLTTSSAGLPYYIPSPSVLVVAFLFVALKFY